MGKSNKIRVLHITTHMGGGVGKFLSQTTKYEKEHNSNYEHEILLLECPQKLGFVDICKEAGINVIIEPAINILEESMKAAEIIVLHWWHHPEMCRLLLNFPQEPSRLVLMSHISGCNYPALHSSLIKQVDKVFFTSPYSYENPFWTEEELEMIEKKSAILYGLGVEATGKTYNRDLIEKKEFIITYIGTINKSKINPCFVEYSKAVIKKIPYAKFVMIGDLEESEEIQKEVSSQGIEKNFDFVGYTKEIDKYLKESDVFGYPLNPSHFGTTENSILEAMASGLPVIMLNQCTEKYIVENNYDGLLVNNELEYAERMEYLCHYPEERERIGRNAMETVAQKFNMKRNVENMHKQFEELLKEKKKKHQFSQVLGEKPIQWFLYGLGKDREVFEQIINGTNDKTLLTRIKECEPILKSRSKSSVQHFAKVYPQESTFQYLERLLKDDEIGE